jgi:chromosome segregation ATPase
MMKRMFQHAEHEAQEGKCAPGAQWSFVIFVLFVSNVLCISGLPAQAQSLEDRLRDQLRSEMNQVQQLQDQQAGLQAAKAAAEKERDDLKAQLAAAQAKLAHASRSAADVQKEAELESQVTQFKDAATQSAGTLQQAQADRDKAQKALDDLQKKFGVCEDKNAKLFKTGNDILDAYEKFDVGDAIGANEPLIGIKRVELENESQGFDDRLYEGKYDPNAKLPAAAPAGGGH